MHGLQLVVRPAPLEEEVVVPLPPRHVPCIRHIPPRPPERPGIVIRGQRSRPSRGTSLPCYGSNVCPDLTSRYLTSRYPNYLRQRKRSLLTLSSSETSSFHEQVHPEARRPAGRAGCKGMRIGPDLTASTHVPARGALRDPQHGLRSGRDLAEPVLGEEALGLHLQAEDAALRAARTGSGAARSNASKPSTYHPVAYLLR